MTTDITAHVEIRWTAVCPYSRLAPERSGECHDLPGIRVPVYPVRCRDGVVEVGLYAVGSLPAATGDAG